MFPEFGNLRRKPLITFRRRPLFREEEAPTRILRQRPIENDPFTFTSAPPIHPSISSSSSNNSTEKEEEEEEEEDIFAFPTTQSEEVRLMIAKEKESLPQIIPIPKKKSLSTTTTTTTKQQKQNIKTKQNSKAKSKAKPPPLTAAATVMNQQQQQRRPISSLSTTTITNNTTTTTTATAAPFDIFDYPASFDTSYSKPFPKNNNTSKPARLFNNRVTIASLLDSSPPPTYSQPTYSQPTYPQLTSSSSSTTITTTINRPNILYSSHSANVLFNSTFRDHQQQQPLEKKRKRNLVGHLKAATGETPENEQKSLNKEYEFSDEDDDEEFRQEQPVSTAKALRSLSPELNYKDKMEKQLNEIMQSEFGVKEEEGKENKVTTERKRYEPLNHRNVRVTFKRSNSHHQQDRSKTVDDDIERVNHLISVIKNSQDR